MEKLDYLFDFIKRNYLLSKKQEEFKLVSNHWDVFQNDFEKVIDNRKIWKECSEILLLWVSTCTLKNK